jgi:hypothetical protein
MKLLIPIFLFVLITFRVSGQLPDFSWAYQCGNPPNSTDTKTALVSCEDGCFYMAGEFLDTAQFGVKTLVASGGTDVFLVKYTAEGEALWSVRMGASDDEYVQKIISDDEGNVVVVGYFYGTTQIGTDSYTTYGSQDLFVAKYNAGGDFLWSFRVGGPMADYLTGLAADQDENFIISGNFYDEITIGDTTLLSLSSSDIFLAKFNPGGDLLWTLSAGGSSSDQVHSSACDADGNILIAGSFYYDFTFGDTTLSTQNPVGAFIAKYMPSGQLSQVFQLDGTYLTTEIFVTAAPGGDFYISGNFSEQITFGTKTFNAGEFNQDIYIAKYDASCDLQWARHGFSYGSDQVVALETDNFGNLYLSGHYLDTLHFELLTLPYTLCCGSREIFIVSYNPEGNVLFGEQISGTRANVQSIELNQQGNLLLSGLFTEEVILGPLSLSHYDGFRNYMTCLETGIYTGLAQKPESIRLAVFPNPAVSKIQIPGTGQVKPAEYKIFSMNGRLVGHGKVNPGDQIDIGFLLPGQYILRMNYAENHIQQSFLFLKQ